MSQALSPTILRNDYQAPAFQVPKVEMGFDLDPECTTVATRLFLQRQHPGPLVLYGEELELLSIAIDGQALTPGQYAHDTSSLTLADLPNHCTLDIAVRINPSANTSLMGLYVSNGNFFTQCEAQGFRKITFFPDRPDVMSQFTVMLRADRKRFPVLLCNGNLIEQGQLSDGRHFAKWHDPFPKPCYLFALVAGKLAHIERTITTMSGKSALLQIYAQKRDLKKLEHAMQALVDAIRWDEQRFGLELDLERFMIVAVDDFNMGAMENKGLNIFNTKYVLATPDIATDADYANVTAVVGHEYFHNWTGNRVTCRDWFQLTLKEGLTVFRDHEFSADMNAGYLQGNNDATARTVQRIEDIRILRTSQFSEDAGPMAHPIRPDSYQEISNFYTATVYEKGAEVVGMLQTLLGVAGFRAGLDEYFRRHDGQAVTCDDFIAAMESVYINNPSPNAPDLKVFRRWYSQAGTPHVVVETDYHAGRKTFTLTLRQSCPPVGIERLQETAKQPFHIPFALGLLDPQGHDMPLRLADEVPQKAPSTTRVVNFTEAQQSFVFVDVAAPPTPSLLRNFSAPVIVDYSYSDAQLAHLSAHDSDAFNRWEAGQRMALNQLVRLSCASSSNHSNTSLSTAWIAALRSTLNDTRLAPALKALALTLPSEIRVGETLSVYDPAAVHQAQCNTRSAIAQALHQEWLTTYHAHHDTTAYVYTPAAAGRRALKNLALSYLVQLQQPEFDKLAWQQFKHSDNMNDRLAAFAILVNSSAQQRDQSIREFYKQGQEDALVVDKWLRVQATAQRIDRPVLEIVISLMQHRAFSLRNPNKIYALLLAFFSANPAEFHQTNGQGYAFWAQQVLAIDAINPQVAARVARALDRWKKLTPDLQISARAALRFVQVAKHLSRDVQEVVEKALQ